MKRNFSVRYLLLLFLHCFYIQCNYAQDNKQINTGQNIFTSMDKMKSNLENIFPYLFSESDFNETKNHKVILEKISAISKEAKNTKKHKDISHNIASKTNINVLLESLNRAEFTFRNNRKASSRYILKSAIQICVGCHTSLIAGRNYSFENNAKILSKLTDNEQVDYLFTTRQFKAAEEILMKRIKDFEQDKVKWIDMQRTINYLAIYYVRVNPSPAKGEELFSKLSKESYVPKEARQDMEAWSKTFKKWKDERGTPQYNELLQNMDAEIGLEPGEFSLTYDASFTIKRMRAYSTIYGFLESQTAKSKEDESKALYYLGIISNSLDSFSMINIGDAYLKACMEDASKTSIAKKCYKAFEESINLQNSGSGGVFLLPEDARELKRYKKMVGLP